MYPEEQVANKNPYSQAGVINDNVDVRATFIMKTYAHLFGAIITFAGLIAILIKIGVALTLYRVLFQGSSFTFLIAIMVLGFAGSIASNVAHSSRSKASQYAALAAYITMEALIFSPLILLANSISMQSDGADIVPTAALATLGIFSVLTAIMFYTRKDLSSWRRYITYAFFGAIALIIVSAITGFTLGPIITVGFIILAGAVVLYSTSNIMHHYHESQYVGASLALFAAIAMLLWHILIFLIQMAGSND